MLDDGTRELIDSKTDLGEIVVNGRSIVFQNVIDGLKRQSEALRQNPGYTGVIEVPDAVVAGKFKELLADIQLYNIRVRERPFW